MVTALSLNTKSRSMKYKKARYAIGNVSMKDLSNKINEFEKFVKVPYLKKTPKHEPTLSYFHLVECLRKCMMRSGEKITTCTTVMEKRRHRHRTLSHGLI